MGLGGRELESSDAAHQTSLRPADGHQFAAEKRATEEKVAHQPVTKNLSKKEDVAGYAFF